MKLFATFRAMRYHVFLATLMFTALASGQSVPTTLGYMGTTTDDAGTMIGTSMVSDCPAVLKSSYTACCSFQSTSLVANNQY